MNVFITQLTWVWNIHVENGPHCLPSLSILWSYFGPINLLEVTIWNQKSWASQRSRYTQWPEEGVRPPEARVSGGCELPGMRAGVRPQVLCTSSKHSYPLNHLPSPSQHVTFEHCFPQVVSIQTRRDDQYLKMWFNMPRKEEEHISSPWNFSILRLCTLHLILSIPCYGHSRHPPSRLWMYLYSL